MAQPKKDERPSRNAWSPGDYECRCLNCDEAFIGDKRAMWCADCVYSDPNSRHIDMLHAKLTAERAKAAANLGRLRAMAVEARRHMASVDEESPAVEAVCVLLEKMQIGDGAALAAAIEAVLAANRPDALIAAVAGLWSAWQSAKGDPT